MKTSLSEKHVEAVMRRGLEAFISQTDELDGFVLLCAATMQHLDPDDIQEGESVLSLLSRIYTHLAR